MLKKYKLTQGESYNNPVDMQSKWQGHWVFEAEEMDPFTEETKERPKKPEEANSGRVSSAVVKYFISLIGEAKSTSNTKEIVKD